MNAIAIDTSVLFAIFNGEPSGARWVEKLRNASETAALLACSVAVAEVRSFFDADEDCIHALSDLEIRHSALTEETALLGGKIYQAYRREGGTRKTILPDFLIAAHASMQADAFATIDRGYQRTYFPQLRFLDLRGV